MKAIIYLDNSATTRTFDESAAVVDRYMKEEYFNASALYQKAAIMEEKIENARKRVLAALGDSGSVIFTSGGTESNNKALLGAISAMGPGKKRLITSMAEHASVINVFKYLETRGCDVVYLKPRTDGAIDPEDVGAALTEDTALVSLMHVNNETGAVADLEEMGYLIKKRSRNALFHCDGVQAFLKMPVNVEKVKIDMYTISSHKFHGPKGVGALYVKKGVKLNPIEYGGGQEEGYRPGTYNTPGILGMDAAIQNYLTNGASYVARMRKCKETMAAEFFRRLDGVFINGPRAAEGAPNILNVSFAEVHGQVLLHAVEEQGVIIGTGAACSSKKEGESRVLLSMGLSKERAQSAVRLSFSPFIEPEQAKEAAAIIIKNVNRLRYPGGKK